MKFTFLRTLDLWLGPALLWTLSPLMKLLQLCLPEPEALPRRRRVVFLKLKGGGSLIIAMPALLAMRRAATDAEFALVCTKETKVFAELTGLFDHYYLIRDQSFLRLIVTGLHALGRSFRACVCVDLEPNSMLATVFCLLTLARQRLGLVKPEAPHRAEAYTEAISFNVHAPIYIYYDQLAELFNDAPIPTVAECRTQLLSHIPDKPKASLSSLEIGLAPFTSDFAPERMMDAEIWANLLWHRMAEKSFRLLIFGSAQNKPASELFIARLHQALPGITITNLCGQYTLGETTAEIVNCDEFWAVDSGLLHIARLLGVPCRSFWGPTNPAQRLRPVDGLVEETLYRPFVCSPCVHLAGPPPCGGDNVCMKTMADTSPDLNPLWPIGI